MLQAPMFDGFSFDPITLGEDGGTASEVDIGGSQIVEALVVSAVFGVINERLDLRFEVALQVVVFQQDRFFRVWCQRSISPWVCGW